MVNENQIIISCPQTTNGEPISPNRQDNIPLWINKSIYWLITKQSSGKTWCEDLLWILQWWTKPNLTETLILCCDILWSTSSYQVQLLYLGCCPLWVRKYAKAWLLLKVFKMPLFPTLQFFLSLVLYFHLFNLYLAAEYSRIRCRSI